MGKLWLNHGKIHRQASGRRVRFGSGEQKDCDSISPHGTRLDLCSGRPQVCPRAVQKSTFDSQHWALAYVRGFGTTEKCRSKSSAVISITIKKEASMRKLLITAAVAISVAASTNAFAAGRGGGGVGGAGVAGSNGIGGNTWTTPPGFGQGNKNGWQGGSVPPGWDNGNRQGWGGQSLPPGLQRRQ